MHPISVPTTVKVVAAALAAAAWPVMMATEVNPSPGQVAAITAVALLAVKGLIEVAAKLIRKQPPIVHPGHTDAANLRDMMLREFGNIKSRLDSVDAEIRVSRERYHDIAGTLSALVLQMKLLMDGRIKPGHRD